jgi:hypothetical protein
MSNSTNSTAELLIALGNLRSSCFACVGESDAPGARRFVEALEGVRTLLTGSGAIRVEPTPDPSVIARELGDLCDAVGAVLAATPRDRLRAEDFRLPFHRLANDLAIARSVLAALPAIMAPRARSMLPSGTDRAVS